MASKLLYEELTYAIIGAAMEVHRVLGPGFLESVYEEALCYELSLRKIPFERQHELEIHYKDFVLPNRFRVELFVDSKVIIENKATKGLTEIDEAQLLNYLKATKIRLGLLINYGTLELEYRRRIL